MPRRRRKGKEPQRSSPKSPTVGGLLRESFASLRSVVGVGAFVIIAGALPIQLIVTAVFVERGLTGDSLLLLQVQSLIDWVFGSVIISAVYNTLSLRSERSEELSLGQTVVRAYRKGLKTWLGLFLTRGMVGFVVGIAALPVFLGLWLVGRLSPGLAALTSDPSAISGLGIGDFLPLLLVVPFAIPGVIIFLRYLLADAVVSLEGIDGFLALQRSRTLMRGRARVVFLALLPLLVPLEALGMLTAASISVVGVWIGAFLTVGMMVLNLSLEVLLFRVYRASSLEHPPPRPASVVEERSGQ